MELLNRKFSRRNAARTILSAGTTGLVAASLAEGAPQPHMQGALRALRNAATQLESAADDKAGHRVKAIQLVKEAIVQVEQGIKAGA